MGALEPLDETSPGWTGRHRCVASDSRVGGVGPVLLMIEVVRYVNNGLEDRYSATFCSFGEGFVGSLKLAIRTPS